MAETNPLCASEITSSVPCKPRSFRYSKCCPGLFAFATLNHEADNFTVAIFGYSNRYMTAFEVLDFLLVLLYRVHRSLSKDNFSDNKRFCHSLTIGSSCSVKLETKDLETDLPQSSSTIFDTLRVETPDTYISNIEAMRAFSFR